ncbi:hypothetical protein ABR737_27325 [Streptomyces sp. Edi2]|uniref:hypothetical protein n=1 Tax=Streptomyces sp. Edi2 TaxID=3162528 RepID=UPI003305D68D
MKLSSGSYAVDGRDGRVGRVVGHQGPLVQLREPGGGRPWACPPHLLRPAPPSAVLAARLRELNWESRMIP